MNKSSNFITIFCSLSDVALQNPTIVGRLNWSKFRKSEKKPNLFFRSVSKYRMEDVGVNVSYFYYQEGKRKQVDNAMFTNLIQSIDSNHERVLKAKAFNKANGYDDSYFKSLEEHYSRIQ